MPAAIPVTRPPAFIVAIPVAVLLHVPPVVALASVVVLPTHTVAEPVMVPAEGVALTVAIFVAYTIPQLPLTA